MGLHHASPGEVVDLATWGEETERGTSKAIAKTEHMELIRIEILRGETIDEHKTPGQIVVQCLKGSVQFSIKNEVKQLGAGSLLYLEGQVPHALKAEEDSVILLIVLRTPR